MYVCVCMCVSVIDIIRDTNKVCVTLLYNFLWISYTLLSRGFALNITGYLS